MIAMFSSSLKHEIGRLPVIPTEIRVLLELPFIVSPYALFVSLRILCNATEILEDVI